VVAVRAFVRLLRTSATVVSVGQKTLRGGGGFRPTVVPLGGVGVAL